ncbi:MAG: AraC family transcriptional regulator [Bacteroidetes bacterium]|nr:AraC family transcriptional regulator [Bacteroidota bacterium]
MPLRKSLILKRKASFFYKLIISVVLVAVFPLFIGTILYYRFSVQSLEQKIYTINEAYLEQMANSLDIVLTNVLDVSKLLLIDPVFKSYSDFPEKEYYLSFINRASDFSADDRKGLISYLDLRNRITEKIELLPILNEFIDSVHFYDATDNTIFRSGELPQILTNAREIQWYADVLEDTNSFPYIMDTRVVWDHRHGDRQILTIVYKNVLDNIPFFINLDIDFLYKNMVDNKIWTENTFFFVMSDFEDLILFDTGQKKVVADLAELSQNSPGSDEKYRVIKHEEEEYYVNTVEVKKMNWNFFSFINRDQFRNEFNLLRIFVFIMAFSILFLILILGYFYSKFMYRPVENLVRYIKRMSDISEGKDQGDLFYIKNYVEYATRKNIDLQKQLAEAMPAYKKDFLSDLLKPHDYSLAEIRERVALLNINLELEHVLAMVILIDDNTYQRLVFKDQLVFRLSLAKIVQDSLQEKFIGEMIELESHKFVCILNTRNEKLTAVYNMAESIIQNIQVALKCESNVAVGSYGRSIFDLLKSYYEAEELLKYQLVFGKGVVLHRKYIEQSYDDAEPNDISESIHNFIDSVKNGKIKDARKRISIIISELFMPENRFSDLKIQQTGIDILNRVLAALDELGIDQTELFTDSENLYFKIQNLNGNLQFESFFHDKLDAIQNYLNQFPGSRKTKNIEIICRILEADYGENMNLNTLADRINLNPSYVSRIFKQSTGTSFVDYLTDLRVEKAKVLLETSNMNVKGICLQVGYWNTNYFIKVFKKKVGKTPGEFRRDLNLKQMDKIVN